MDRNFDDEIQKLKSQIEKVNAQMEEIQKDFIAATAEFIKNWYFTETTNLVTTEVEKTKKLAADKLIELKSKLSKLQEQADIIIAKYLQDDKLWWHRKQIDQFYAYHGNKPPDHLDNRIRLIAGKLAPLLEEYGYISTDKDNSWREYDERGMHHSTNARPYYPFYMEWSDKMIKCLKRYDEMYDNARRKAREIESYKSQKEKNIVEELWKKA